MRLLCLWDSPGKNTGVDCHALLQGIFPTQGSNLHLLCLLHCRKILYPLSHLGTLLNSFCMTCETFMIGAPWILATLIMAYTSLSHFLCGSDSQALLWAFFWVFFLCLECSSLTEWLILHQLSCIHLVISWVVFPKHIIWGPLQYSSLNDTYELSDSSTKWEFFKHKKYILFNFSKNDLYPCSS